MRRAFAMLALITACESSDDTNPPIETGVRLTVEYESLLDVRTIQISGELIGKSTHPVPLSVDPPGIRQVELLLPVMSPGTVEIAADGLDRSDTVIASGRTSVSVTAGQVAPARIVLTPPIDCRTDVCPMCGNGRVEPGEMCDDGGTLPGDGCDPLCRLEGNIVHAYEIEQLETQTTTSAAWTPIPGTELSFEPNDSSETWLIFASGVLRSTDASEISAEMRLMVDGQEADRFGHQTVGGTDNWAGFITFDRVNVGSKARITASLEFRAEVGSTEVDDLRILALRVPAAADLQWLEIDETEESALIGGDLGTLRFTPSFAGNYLVLAKLNHSELPGVDTVRSWLEHDGGTRHPNDSNGSTFSNGRGALAPIFVAFSQYLDLREHAFTLRGDSSASLNAAWWDRAYDHRIPLTVSTSSEAPAGYAVRVTFDHAALVDAGWSLADGSDVRVVRGTTELDRVLDPDSDWNQPATTIWFATAEAIAAGATDTYDLYFGNRNAGPPPDDPSLVFTFFDGFDGTALDANAWTTMEGGTTVEGGELSVGPGTRVEHNRAYPENTIWEVKSRLSVPVALRMIWLGGTGEGGTMSWFADASDHHAESNGFLTHFDARTPTDFHVWRIARDGTAFVRFFQDDTPIATHDTVPVGRLVPYLANDAVAPVMVYDWIRIRPYVNPEPQVTLGTMVSIRGGLPSTWSHRKILAMRADAFESTAYAESLAAETTTSTTFQPKTELMGGTGRYVAIQSMRISGVSSNDARKSGELRASGVPLLTTSHKINRTSDELSGYHHVAGVVDLREETAPVLHENGFYSPDGISVRAAESVIILLGLP